MRPGQLDQHRVTDLVAVLVVDRLEAVEVEHQRRERSTESRGALDFVAEADGQVTVIPQTGQRIGEAEPLRLLMQQHVVDRDAGLCAERENRVEVVRRELSRALLVVEISTPTMRPDCLSGTAITDAASGSLGTRRNPGPSPTRPHTGSPMAATWPEMPLPRGTTVPHIDALGNLAPTHLHSEIAVAVEEHDRAAGRLSTADRGVEDDREKSRRGRACA